MDDEANDRPAFDQELAESYVGKYILVGITYVDHEDNMIEQVQMHGVVEAADSTGIRIALRGDREGQTWSLPPDLRGITLAQPGRYRLRGTGEFIEDPDLLTTWTVKKPPPGWSSDSLD